MGQFNSVCHFSGLLITENEPIYMLPVKYTSVSYDRLVVNTDNCIYPTFPMFKGKYNGFGSINNVTNDYLLNHFRKFIVNINLSDNEFFKQSFGLIKKKKYDTYEHLEFFSDNELLNSITTKKGLYDIKEIENNEKMLIILSDRALFECSNGNIFRHHSLLIKKSFFDLMVNKKYLKLKETIRNNIIQMFDGIPIDEYKDDEFFYFNRDYISSEVFLLFNDHHSVSYKLSQLIKSVIKDNTDNNIEKTDIFIKSLQNFIDDLTDYSLILHMYADIGKSFYPTGTLRNMGNLNDYVEVLQSELKRIQSHNFDYYTESNGYSKETIDGNKWNPEFFD